MTAQSGSRAALIKDQVDRAIERADFNSALSVVNENMNLAIRSSIEHRLLGFGSPDLDLLCRDIGRCLLLTMRIDQTAAPRANLDIYVASVIFGVGGHTRLIGDYVRNIKGRKALLLLTNSANKQMDLVPEILAPTGLSPGDVKVCPHRRPIEKLNWLVTQLSSYRPDRVFLFNHPQDSSAIAAVQPRLCRRFYFVHHVDRNPCLGAFMPGVVHIDTTPFNFHSCREHVNSSNLFVPLVVDDLGCRDFSRLGQNADGLATASSGAFNKFRLDYEPNYFGVIARVLKMTRGRHLHIGLLPPGGLKQFQQALTKEGVDPDRLVYRRYVRSLWQALNEYSIDLYIGSFPFGGARASVEVMGSGTPAVWHVQSEATFYRDTHMRYPAAAVWRTTEELCDLVARIDPHWLKRQGAAARAAYEQGHNPRQLFSLFGENKITSAPPPPAEGFVSTQVTSFEELLVDELRARPRLDSRVGDF